jgi:hypothetical protein
MAVIYARIVCVQAKMMHDPMRPPSAMGGMNPELAMKLEGAGPGVNPAAIAAAERSNSLQPNLSGGPNPRMLAALGMNPGTAGSPTIGGQVGARLGYQQRLAAHEPCFDHSSVWMLTVVVL